MPDPGPQVALSSDGRQLHLQHGPIDLIVEVDGSPGACSAARRAACRRFDGLLEDLVAELPLLRTALGAAGRPPSPSGAVAARMVAAVAPHRHEELVSPMAAVAGAVADEVGSALSAAAPLDRWFVNNGGDIAFGLAPGQRYRTGLVVDPRHAAPAATITIDAGSGVRGIATSGRHGRSFSMGIADAVTALAPTAAAADAAATLIANHVDPGPSAAIVRRPAVELDPDSDLHDRLVVTEVGVLTRSEVDEALSRGLARAESYVEQGHILAAVLHLAGRTAATSAAPMASLETTAGPQPVGSG